MKSTYTVTYVLNGRTGEMTLQATSADNACDYVRACRQGCKIVHVMNYAKFALAA